MTTENLIPRLDVTETVEQNPAQTTSIESEQSVETTQVTNLMSGSDTSIEGDKWEKRYKDLQSFQSKRENELRKKIAELEAADSSFTAPTTPEEMEAYKERHPQEYNMMLTLAHQTTSEATQGISAQLQTYEEERMMTEFTEAQSRIKLKHPDFMEVVQSNDFQTWAQNEPAQVQQWIYNNPDDPDLAIIALDRYKATLDAKAHEAEAHLEEEAQNKQTLADIESAALEVGGSSAPQTKEGARIWKASEIKTMSQRDWAKYSEDIDNAYDEGRVNFNA